MAVNINIGHGARETLAADVGSVSSAEMILDKMESVKSSEKQILVDPTSLASAKFVALHNLLPPKTSKVMTCSLPNSASSSPRFTKHKHTRKNHQGRVSPLAQSLARQHSVALTNLERLRESHLRRSKSCGEGRACQPSVDFDLWSTANKIKMDKNNHNVDAKQEEATMIFQQLEGESSSYDEDKFKCGACLFLPGFSKGSKAVRARKDVEQEQMERAGAGAGGTLMRHIDFIATSQSQSQSQSQRVSLEKFECGSWRSSVIINNNNNNYEDHQDGVDTTSTSNLFFDLPVELIRCNSVNDTESPVTTGFVFDNINHHRQGGLKTRSSSSRKSHEFCCGNDSSSRLVRFSTSSPVGPASPTSFSSRLRKARDDLSAFLEAQSA